MVQETPLRLPKIGLRNLKTALSATLCALLYALTGRNPTFACIGAIFGMGSDLGDSWKNGGNRLIGTVMGGFLGMGLFWIYTHLPGSASTEHFWLLPLLFVGVVILIVCAQFFHWPGAVQPGGVVLCIILFNTPTDTYVVYALSRMIDTAVGVLVSLGINLLLPRERLDRALARWQAWQSHRKAGSHE